MSHFTVAVIHKPKQNVDDLLAPYYEWLEVEPYINRTVDKIIEDGIKRVERYLKDSKEDPKKYLDVERYGWMRPYLEAYEVKDWDKMYLAEREGETFDKDGNELTMYNPKSKWDWYSIGGRWAGMLNVSSKWVDEEYDGSGYVSDSAPIKVVDFSPNMDKYNRLKEWWEENVDSDEKEWTDFYRKEYYTDYYHDAHDYALRNSVFSTYAVVTSDGEWHERGEMGWFGMSSETPEEGEDWDINYYKNFIATADPEDWITIVDCHI